MSDLGGRIEDELEVAGDMPGENERVKETVYIAGPMRGIPMYNFPAFDLAAERIRAVGHDALNPADMDRAHGFDPRDLPPDHDWNTIPKGFDFNDCVSRDIQAVRKADRLYMLRGWELSKGARAEHAIAEWLGKAIFYEEKRPEGHRDLVSGTVSEEVCVTDPKTGGQKCSKLERFDLIPPEIWKRLARHYGVGAQKYEDDNWLRGYSWRLSIAALHRHINAFLCGESIDAETRSHHLVAAMWHCIALQEFERLGLGTDDRYCTKDAHRTQGNAAAC